MKIRDLGYVAENFLGLVLDVLCYVLFVDPEPRWGGAGRCFLSHCVLDPFARGESVPMSL